MNFAYKGKTKVCLNGKYLGYANHVGIDRKEGEVLVNITINSAIQNEKNKVISQETNYQTFFNKFSKAFGKH